MSTENVYKLVALGAQDASVRAALEKAEANDAGAKAIVALGKTHGLDFTVADALKVRGELETALSDDDLAKISGGIIDNCTPGMDWMNGRQSLGMPGADGKGRPPLMPGADGKGRPPLMPGADGKGRPPMMPGADGKGRPPLDLTPGTIKW